MEPVNRLDTPEVTITEDMPEKLVSFIRLYESIDQALIRGEQAIEFTQRANDVLVRMEHDPEYSYAQALWELEELTQGLSHELEEVEHD